MRFSLLDLTRDFVENETHKKELRQMCRLDVPSSNFDTLCSADSKGNLRVWSTENPSRLQLVNDLDNAHGGSISGMCSANGLLFTGSR